MIDWSAAPDGATYYTADLWYCVIGERPYYWAGVWRPSGFSTIDDVRLSVNLLERRPVEPQTCYQNAASYCQAAMSHMVDRASTYDAPAGERSMAKTVAAFNTITGHSLTEEQGWLFMETLKMVRSQQGDFKRDNYEDAVAYAALRGEAAEKGRQQ